MDNPPQERDGTFFDEFNVDPPLSPEQLQERLDKVREMLARNPGIAHIRTNYGATALEASIIRGETEIVRLLLEHGADANEDTPLDIALTYNPNPEIVSMLFEHGADPYYRAAGKTLLMTACCGCLPWECETSEADMEATLRLLLALPKLVNQRCKGGSTALHWVYHAGFIPILCAHGAEINVQDNEGKTPLHSYVDGSYGSINKVELVEALLPYGPELNIQNDAGETPLHHVAFDYETTKFPKIVRMLLAAGADPSIQDKKGQTPLHLGVESRYWEVITQLVEAGAEMNLRDEQGRTPLKMLDYDFELDMRYGSGKPKIEEYLLQAGAHL